MRVWITESGYIKWVDNDDPYYFKDGLRPPALNPNRDIEVCEYWMVLK